ncbi:MAG TPA: thiamine-phosphate kinase [Candidatus Polarisedimenticolia bacterium]
MAARERLTEQGFIALIARLARPLRPRPLLGIGDDAALLDLPSRACVLLTTDLLAEGIHFRSSYMPGRLLGRKALAVNLSDVAAMGGAPHSFVVSVGFPREMSFEAARAFARGLAEQARRFGVALVGGDTCAARSLTVSITLLGLVEPGRAVTRSGARAGDGLYVTGRLGASAAGLSLLRRGVRIGRGGGLRGAGLPRSLHGAARQAIRAHLDPTPRTVAGRALGVTGLAAAMIDLSDGLARDLPRLCGASGRGAVVEEAAIPLSPAAVALLGPSRARRGALQGGEDYELLFAARPGLDPLIGRLARRIGLPIARIGELLPRREGIRLLGTDGRYRPLGRGGFEHFPVPRAGRRSTRRIDPRAR